MTRRLHIFPPKSPVKLPRLISVLYFPTPTSTIFSLLSPQSRQSHGHRRHRKQIILKNYYPSLLRIRSDLGEMIATDYTGLSTIFHENGKKWLQITTSL